MLEYAITIQPEITLYLYNSVHYVNKNYNVSNAIPLVPNEFSPNLCSSYGSAKCFPVADVSELQL